MNMFNARINNSRMIKAVCFGSLLIILVKFVNYYLYDDNTYTRVMMHELYNQRNIDVCISGASSAYRHFNPGIWDTVLQSDTFNVGSSAQRPESSYYVLKEIFNQYKPKYVIYSISAFMFTQYSRWDSPTKDYILFDYMPVSLNKVIYGLRVFKGNLVNGFIEFSRNRNNDLMDTLTKVKKVKDKNTYKSFSYQVYDDSDEILHPKGYVSAGRHLVIGEVGKLNTVQFRDYELRSVDVEYMLKIADLCRDNDCELIIVVPPMHYGSMANYYDYQEVVDFNRNIADSIGAPIFDFSLAKHDFFSMKDSYYYDWAHMSGDGADFFSTVCSEFIKRYISGEEINNDDYFYKSYQELLEDTPWIYNAWIVKDENGYQAFCNHGNGVTPLYSFWGSEDNGDTWELIEDYSSSDTVSFDDVDENYNMLMVKAKDVNSKSEYDQLYRMTLE